jgi:hypothetical protein
VVSKLCVRRGEILTLVFSCCTSNALCLDDRFHKLREVFSACWDYGAVRCDFRPIETYESMYDKWSPSCHQHSSVTGIKPIMFCVVLVYGIFRLRQESVNAFEPRIRSYADYCRAIVVARLLFAPRRMRLALVTNVHNLSSVIARVRGDR